MAKARRVGGRGAKVFIDIGLIGDKDLQKKLNKLQGKDAKAVIRKVLRNQQKEIKKRADALVPTKSGALKASLRIRAGKRSRKRISVVLIAGGKRSIGKTESKRRGIAEGATEEAYYASFVELGTDKQPAQSFMRKARDDYQPTFDKRVGDMIFEEIVRMVGKRQAPHTKK